MTSGLSMSQSQTTFLESIVEWDQQKCQDNIEEALPKLFSCLSGTDIIQEQVGILKIIFHSFLPCVDIFEAEKKIFSQVTSETCSIFDKLIQSIKQKTECLQQDLCVVKQDITSLLDTLLSIVDCYEGCLKCVQATEVELQWTHIHSLPAGAIHILKGTYTHCKESGELYGEFLSHVSEPLSALFRKAHSLQSVFIHLLEKVTKTSSALLHQDVQDLCVVCHGLFEICQVVTSLDMKLVVTLWKILSKYAIQYKELLRERLEVSCMVEYLCHQIQTGYDYLFQLLPHVDDEGMVLSQGDEKGFQKSVKILGFQMKIMVSLVRDYVHTLNGCEKNIYTTLIQIHKSLPPSLFAPRLQDAHIHEIKRQLVNATEPLVISLLCSNTFMKCLTSVESVTKLTRDESLPHLLMIMMVLEALPKSFADDVRETLICPSTDEDLSVVSLVFLLAKKCYIEVCLPVYLPGPMFDGKPQKDVSLYEYICTKFCGFIGSFPSSVFHKLECVLLENLLSPDPVCSFLAVDSWCFMGRYGSADLCYSHVIFMLELYQKLNGPSLQCNSLVTLITRLMKFLATHHQHDILKKYPPEDNILLWSKLPVDTVPSNELRDVVDRLCNKCIKNLHNFNSSTEKTHQHFTQLNVTLDCLLNILKNKAVVEKYLSPSSQSMILSRTCAVWASILVSDWMTIELSQVVLGKLFHLTGTIICLLTTADLMKVFSVLTAVLRNQPIQYLKLSIIDYLRSCGQLKLSPSFEQTEILKKLSEGFTMTLSDKDSSIHHTALQAFTIFAEQTIHESVVPDCMQREPKLQDIVVSYLNKVAYSDKHSLSRQSYLEWQCTNIQNLPDEVVSEPLMKRQKIDTGDDLLRAEDQNNNANLLKILKKCVNSLEQLPTDNVNKQQWPDQLTQDLRLAYQRIGSVLSEYG